MYLWGNLQSDYQRLELANKGCQASPQDFQVNSESRGNSTMGFLETGCIRLLGCNHSWLWENKMIAATAMPPANHAPALVNEDLDAGAR